MYMTGTAGVATTIAIGATSTAIAAGVMDAGMLGAAAGYGLSTMVNQRYGRVVNSNDNCSIEESKVLALPEPITKNIHCNQAPMFSRWITEIRCRELWVNIKN